MDTIAFNRSFVAWDRWGFAPTYYACLDPVGIANNGQEIADLIDHHRHTSFFLNRTAAAFGIEASSRVVLAAVTEGDQFSVDLTALTDFGNVGASSLQILAALGYRRVAMVGVDGRHLPLTEPTTAPDERGLVMRDDNPNYFCAEYVRGKKQPASLNLEKIFGQWPVVAGACKRLGVDVVNASPGSALTCFPALGFEEAITWVTAPLIPACPQA